MARLLKERLQAQLLHNSRVAHSHPPHRQQLSPVRRRLLARAAESPDPPLARSPPLLPQARDAPNPLSSALPHKPPQREPHPLHPTPIHPLLDPPPEWVQPGQMLQQM